MFKFLSRNKTHVFNDNDKHDVTISDSEIFVDTNPEEKIDNYQTNIIHIKGNVDHLYIEGSPKIVIDGNVNGNVFMSDCSWITCGNINGDIKTSNPEHIENISNEKCNKETIICD